MSTDMNSFDNTEEEINVQNLIAKGLYRPKDYEGNFQHSKRGEVCRKCERALGAKYKCPIEGVVETMSSCQYFI